MKVLQINTVCGVGSTGKIAKDLYDILIEQGHECKIAYGRGTAHGIPAEDGIRIGNDFDMYAHALRTRITDGAGLYSRIATKRFIEQIREYNPDIIHLHNIHGYYLQVELLFEYIKQANKRVIWTLHDCWSFTGHCVYFDRIACDKWRVQCQDCQQKKEYPESKIMDRSKRNYQRKKQAFTGVNDMTIVTPSQWLKDLVKESYLKDYRVEVVHNGIDLNQFKKNDSTKEKMLLGVANIWEERKGLPDFIELRRMLDESYEIILVGLTEEQIQSLPAGIQGIKRTNSVEELVKLYSQTTVFVNPTYEETLGMVNVEALACGTPVITYKTGGSPECIDETCGYVVECGDIEAMKTRIIEVCEQETLTQEACVKRSKIFEKEARYMDYMQLYKEI